MRRVTAHALEQEHDRTDPVLSSTGIKAHTRLFFDKGNFDHLAEEVSSMFLHCKGMFFFLCN